jgi:hypothetical protein
VLRCAFALFLITHHSSLITAQEPPLVGQPTENFYGAQGSGVKVAWSLDRTSVRLDEEIVATLTIAKATNPTKIVRPDLRKLPAFESLFTILDNPDPPPETDAKAVKFTYRLRPRDRDVKKVPTLEFHYYNPAAAQGKQFPLTTTGRAIEITVTAPAPKPAPPVVPLGVPEHLFAVATGPDVLKGDPLVPSYWACVAATVLGPVLALGWYIAWRRIYPDAARLAKMRRSRAARRAVDTIRRAARTPDPAATLANAVLGYLRARFPLPPGAVTPIEIGSALTELGVPASECETATGFFRECDTARFSPSIDNGMSLAADAEALVARLEAA